MVIKSYYINALKLGILLIVGLLLINYFIDQQRITKLNEEFLNSAWQMQDSKLFLLFNQFINENDKDSYCNMLNQRLAQIINRNSMFLEKLKQYEKVNVLSNDYKQLKTTFSLNHLELFFYYVDFKKKCNNNVHYILYFYPENIDCMKCSVQADVLDNVRDSCSDVFIFALPTNSDIDIINLINNQYNITETPSIVIDDKTFNGLVDKDSIIKEINCKNANL
ncbi:MAG: hypothetical protein KJ623_04430 [Nanoarchaeota archaeon]|nr:hypothetical protein [Nanoarchaeota archaeon]MBU0962900.1 hypothetical protein [Nanoarchaeota archaeon]